MNIPLLREVQASITNLDRPFSMDCWHCCVAGHVRMVLEARGKTDRRWDSQPLLMAQQALDMDRTLAHGLCYAQTFGVSTRQGIIKLIDRLIAQAEGRDWRTCANCVVSPVKLPSWESTMGTTVALHQGHEVALQASLPLGQRKTSAEELMRRGRAWEQMEQCEPELVGV